MRSLSVACVFAILVSTIALAKSNPVPLINQPLVPASVVPGRKGFTLTVNGTGFASSAVVHWNGSPRKTKFVSSSNLQARISARDVAKASTVSVAVVNPHGGISNIVYFPIRKPSSTVAFAVHQQLTAPGWVTVGDFNNDGKLDVAVGPGVEFSGGKIEVYLGKGDGTFSSPVETISSIDIVSMVAGDFNGDGKLDLAVSGSKGKDLSATAILLGNGDGTLTETSSLGVGGDSVEAVGDWNGDGKLDLIASQSNEQYKWSSVFLGNGDGTFTVSQESIGPANFPPTGDSAVGDFNGDGKIDVAFNLGNRVAVALGNGDGTFQDAVFYPEQYPSGSVVAADVNGDGKLDLITSGVSVLLGNGDGTFTSAGGVNLGASRVVAIGDFNGDHKLDLAVVTVSLHKQTLNILLGNGDGTFQNPLTFTTDNQMDLLLGFGVGDFNGDGKLDFVVGGLAPNPTLFLQKVHK